MEKSALIDQKLLEGNIKQIAFYTNEETSQLKKITNQLKICNNIYKSKNNYILASDINELNNNINSISIKRQKYAKTLNDVIKLYNKVENLTIQKFGGIS